MRGGCPPPVTILSVGPQPVAWPFVAGRGTTATIARQRAKIPFTLHEYGHDPRSASYSLEAADALGRPPGQVFKTLVAATGGRVAPLAAAAAP